MLCSAISAGAQTLGGENPFSSPGLMLGAAEPVRAEARPVRDLPLFPQLAAAVRQPARVAEALTKSKALAGTRKLAAKFDVSRIGDRGIGGGLNFYSIEKEINLGRALAEELEAQVRLITDPVITEYVNRIGQNIVRNSDAKVPFTIKVVDDSELNAFALPGGFFYVNAGLIMAADNEAELAGVMAHEIAHVAARHATKNATKSDLWNLASIPLVFVGGPVGMAVRQVADIALPMTFLKFSRDAERDADLLGLQYQYASGYDPSAFISFFEKVQAGEKKNPNFVARAFSTHPMNEDRVKRSHRTITEYLPAKEEYVLTTSEFDEVKARLGRMLDTRQVDAGFGQKPQLRRRSADTPQQETPGRK